jgi:hypothetical protein
MCQNSVKIILFLGSLLICLFRLGSFGRVLQMCVCACVHVCVCARAGGGKRRVSHAHMQSLCEMDWKADPARFKGLWYAFWESVDVLVFFFGCFFSVFFFLSWLSWLCVGEMSLRQVCVSCRHLILNSFLPRPHKNTKHSWLWHHFK